MSVINYNYTTNNDAQYENDFNASFLRTLNVGADQSFDQVAASKVNAYPGYSSDDLMTIESILGGLETQFTGVTDVIKVSNNLQNVNQYISNSYDIEKKRIGGVLNSSVNDVYLSRETFMLVKYNIAFQHFLINVIQFSLFVAIICAFLICFTFYDKFKITWTIAISVISLVLVIYLAGVVIFYRETLVRRKDDWDKFYFNTPESINGTVCNKR